MREPQGTWWCELFLNFRAVLGPETARGLGWNVGALGICCSSLGLLLELVLGMLGVAHGP